MTFLINQVIFILINVLMAFNDSEKIKRSIKPDHFLNGWAYLLAVIIFIMIFAMQWYDIVLFTPACFCNRQLFFDIPLNLMRKLKWDYVSPDPASKVDQIEKKLFGKNGRIPNYIYGSVLIITILINLIFDL